MENCDVAIVGAGPYGLSAAAHLGQIHGLNLKLLGEPMSFWERYMPERMLLRSPWAGSHIADPDNRLTLDAYGTLNGNGQLKYPVAVSDFVKYGHWFHQQVAVPADRRKVTRVEPVPDGYQLTLGDGDVLHARRVVVAGGIQPFVHRPSLFHGLPASMVTHTSDAHDFGRFRGQDVFVVGAGQSALEAAGFLGEAGAHVEVLIRDSVLHWLGHREWMHAKALSWMFYGRADVGPAGMSLVVQRPHLFRRLPRGVQDRWGRRAVRPAVSHRVAPRTRGIAIHVGRGIVRARSEGERLHVWLNDGTERTVHHVVLGTGYRVNMSLYPFLSPEILARVDVVNGYPRLDTGFETSLPGLHVIGAPAAWSFGPLMRFVAGTEFTARALARRVLQAKNRSVVSCLEQSPVRV